MNAWFVSENQKRDYSIHKLKSQEILNERCDMQDDDDRIYMIKAWW